MKRYAKAVNDEGLCQVGADKNTDYYKSIGMELLDVEQSEIDGNWYLAEKCPHYTEEELSSVREQQFKSLFFEIPNIGWFRKVPKDYQSAVESMNTAFNTVSILGRLPARTLTFYIQPDFRKDEECTEEWLVANSFKNSEMTASQFGEIYVAFTSAWNTEKHE